MVNGDADHDAGSGIVESWRRRLAAGLLIVRIDARRPASWGACAVAAVAARAAGAADVGLSLAVVGGALAAAVGIGDPPRGVAAAGGRPAFAWWCARAVWPLAGAALIAAAGGDPLASAVVAAAIVATAMIMLAAATRGLPAADASSLGLVPAAAATMAGLVSVSSGHAWLPAVALGWLVSAAAALRLAAATDAVDAWRRGVQVAAMTTTLAAMAGCFFLATEHARWYAPLVAAWFLSAALPQAVLGAGTLDEMPRERLLRSAAPTPATGGVPRPVFAVARRAAAVAAAWVAILGWPAMVAAALWGNGAARGDGPLTTLLVLTVMAATLVLVTGLVRWAGGSGETALAAAAVVVVTAAIWLFPMSLIRPALPQPLSLVAGGPPRTAVEGFGRSCQTP